MEFVGSVVDQFGLSSLKTLEIGSYNVNGSVRPLFKGEYTGIDRSSGPGVDLVMDAFDLSYFADAAFDVVVSTSQLEHDPTFWLTLPEVARVLRPGGYFILTTHTTGFPEHNRPDYYRFLDDTWPLLMNMAACDIVRARGDPQVGGGPQMIGKRR
jgi:SAM-dependent methyltransferase